ncbi:MAG: hypothetical protein A2563_03525 [Candidatus Magasanikbacteria bacterium RIFOXYD1_FULL_40_23]|uniref:Uncharacterized protein n=1 Tax=Candidatus Magasanikbacteria bacterium RIFOXYD1_FULL_40_23 TaxID=1798705 RepID=A0A1F6P954_9BACT|nr:MAG: hypothetical protein A2563_03525 [Candidatus Magasanikbacteria bacterium RIFOXYD1_FULL_40_23]
MAFEQKQATGSGALDNSAEGASYRAGAGGQKGNGAAAGKVPATSKLRVKPKQAAEPEEIVMTGHPLLDKGLACDDREGKAPECPLDERDAKRLEDMVERAGTAYCMAMIMALGNLYLEFKTKHHKTWGPWHEIFFLVVTTAAFGPLGALGASVGARAAVGLAMRGATRAAWTAASIDASKLIGVFTTMSKGVRSSLAHRSVDMPTDEIEFIKYMQDQVPGFVENLMQGIAEHELDQLEMLEVVARLQDPDISGRAAIEHRGRTLLAQFGENRIGSIGNVMDLGGGYEVATPVRVRLRKKELMVLCESLGVHHSALALNGANLDLEPGVSKMTMESLVYVKMIEPAFHELVTAEYSGKRKEEVPFINFDDCAERKKHRWFKDMYHDMKRRERLEKYIDDMHNIGGLPANDMDDENNGDMVAEAGE